MIVVSQVIAALLAPWAGAIAQRKGRRPILLLGFAAVPFGYFRAACRRPRFRHSMVSARRYSG
jgi:MFS family permease